MRIVSLAAASVFAISAFAAPTDYYMPEGWESYDTDFAGLYVTGGKGGSTKEVYVQDKDGKINANGVIYNDAIEAGIGLGLSGPDILFFCATIAAWRNSNKIKTLGTSVDRIFSSDGITLTGGAGGAFNISFKNMKKIARGEATTIEGGSTQNLSDSASLQQMANGRLQLMGWDRKGKRQYMLAYNNGALAYLPMPQMTERARDEISISTNLLGKYSIEGWSTRGTCAEKLADIVWSGSSNHDFLTRHASNIVHYVDATSGISNKVAQAATRIVNNLATNLTTAGSTASRCPIAGGVGLSYTESEGFTWTGTYDFEGWNDKVGIHFKREYGDVPFVGFAHAATQTDPEYLEVKYTNVFKLAESTLAAATNAIPPIVREEMEDYVPYELAKDDPINCNNHAFQVNANFETWFAINPGNSSAQINGTYVYIGTNTSFSGSVSLPPATSVNGESLTNIAAQAAAAVKSEDNSVTGIRVEDQGGTKYLIINNGGMQYKVALENL